MATDPENLETEALLPEEPKTEVARFGLGPGVVLFLAGTVFGLLGAFLQAVTVSIGDIALPVGLILILATLFASLRMVIHIYGLRRAGVVVLVGWTLATVVLSLPGPGGDVAIPGLSEGLGGIYAIIYLLGGVVIGTACVNVPAQLRDQKGET